ncbi:MAG: transposase [Elusimicrobia bacterium]|nr:transposase [Elusimicrobiota bacterium]
MARLLRLEIPGAYYYVMSRGNEERPVFKNDADYRRFLELIGEAAGRWQAVVHAYALLKNYFHLIFEARGGFLSLPMRHIVGNYTQYFNRSHKRAGHLFQGRFKASLIEKNPYLANLTRHIHQSPIKVKLAEPPEDYPWSSYRAFLGLDKIPSWLNPDETLKEFGLSDKERRRAYQAFMEAKDNAAANFFKIINGKILETPKLSKAYAKAGLQTAGLGAQKTADLLCETLNAGRKTLFENRWGHDELRQIAMLLLRDKCALPLGEIAAMFKISPPAASQGIKRLRKRARFDKNMEQRIAGLGQKFLEALTAVPERAGGGRQSSKKDRWLSEGID